MLILAFLILFLVIYLLIILPLQVSRRIKKNSPNSVWTCSPARTYPPKFYPPPAQRPYSPRPDFNVQRPDFNFPNPNQNKSSKPKQQMYFEAGEYGLSSRYQPEIEHLLLRTGCRVEVEVAWLVDYKEVSSYGTRTGTAGGKPCYIAKFQDQVDRIETTTKYTKITLCGYATETRYIGRTHTLYYVDWYSYKPTMFISSIRFLED